MTDSLNEKWLIISWQQFDTEQQPHGKLLETVIGTFEDAKAEAYKFIPTLSPVGIVKEIV